MKANRQTEMKRRAYKLRAQICSVMASDKRLEILDLLSDGEKSVEELTQAMGISKANVSQHLAIMRQNRIVVTRREGQTIYYRVSNDKVIEACRLMREVTMVLLAQGRELSSLLEE